MTKRQRMTDEIINHGNNLIALFGLPEDGNPITLCKKLRRVEVKARQLSTAYCNGKRGMTDEDKSALDVEYARLMGRVDTLLHFKVQGVPVILNTDPRGYALKIDNDWMRAHNTTIFVDMGGYGIIVPEFTGN